MLASTALSMLIVWNAFIGEHPSRQLSSSAAAVVLAVFAVALVSYMVFS
jgi:hypothetical protein